MLLCMMYMEHLMFRMFLCTCRNTCTHNCPCDQSVLCQFCGIYNIHFHRASFVSLYSITSINLAGVNLHICINLSSLQFKLLVKVRRMLMKRLRGQGTHRWKVGNLTVRLVTCTDWKKTKLTPGHLCRPSVALS